MHLNEFIKVYDDALQIKTVSSFLKWLNYQSYQLGKIGHKDNTRIDKEVRDVELLPMMTNNRSLTYRHWSNFLGFIFKNGILKYAREVTPFHGTTAEGINDITVLKYEKGGHYSLHIDAAPTIPRQLSCILMLNNDYEGGHLKFADPKDNHVYLDVDPKPGRLIVWPSNFAFPHGVTPVTEGKRYVVVAWAN
jgi:hypothetical protein